MKFADFYEVFTAQVVANTMSMFYCKNHEFSEKPLRTSCRTAAHPDSLGARSVGVGVDASVDTKLMVRPPSW